MRPLAASPVDRRGHQGLGGVPIGLSSNDMVIMLVIDLINTREVMRKRIGRLGDRLVGSVLDHEAEVEKAVIQELETAFKSFGIEANILSVEGVELMGNRLEVPLKLREQRQVVPPNAQDQGL